MCSVETSYYSGIVVKYIQQHIYTTSIHVSREVEPIDRDKEHHSAVGWGPIDRDKEHHSAVGWGSIDRDKEYRSAVGKEAYRQR